VFWNFKHHLNIIVVSLLSFRSILTWVWLSLSLNHGETKYLYFLIMDALEKLEVLNLVSRLTEEISNYIGVSDKTLAEFVLELHEQSKDVAELKEKLSQVGADFPENFVDNIDRVIRQLHPKYKRNNSSVNKEKVFKGLSLPDTAPVQHEDRDGNDGGNVVDDALSELKSLSQRNNARSTMRKRDRESRSPPPLSSRSRSRRDQSPDYDRDRRHYRSPDDREPRRNRSPRDDIDRRRNRSPRDNTDRRRRVYSNEHQDGKDQYGREYRQVDLDEKPIIGKVYDGRVISVKPYGAFVTLEGVKGKVDGKCVFVLFFFFFFYFDLTRMGLTIY
jgi:ATP-dependent RNA helicase DHX8/PRP22